MVIEGVEVVVAELPHPLTRPRVELEELLRAGSGSVGLMERVVDQEGVGQMGP